jgi:hypothetical protein
LKVEKAKNEEVTQRSQRTQSSQRIGAQDPGTDSVPGATAEKRDEERRVFGV